MSIFSSLKRKFRYGFTLIELLLVIGIIAILAAIVIVAINPTKQLGDARDAQRRSDVNTILNAVYQYAIDNNGTLPSGIPTGTASSAIEICRTTIADSACEVNASQSGVNLESLTGSYLVGVPVDPQAVNSTGTFYKIHKDSNGRVTVTAMTNEGGTTISVTR